MASVKQFRKGDGGVWYACYKVPTGAFGAQGQPLFKRVQRSTGVKDKATALQVAISYERASVLVAQKRWTETSAHRFLTELQVLSGVEIPQVEQTERFLSRWLEGKRKFVSIKTWKNFSGIIADFLAWLGPRKGSPLIEVTSHIVAQFRDAEVARGKAGTTVNKALSVLGQAFAEAVVQHSLEKNPAVGLRIKGAAKLAQQRSHFTFEQFRQLVQRTGPGELSNRGNEVNAEWQTFILATGYTGGRQQEVAKLKWANVDLVNYKVCLVRSKTRDTHWMPLHSALHKHLSALAVTGSGAPEALYVMPHLAELKEREISKIFRETILPRVGIVQPYQERTDEKGVGRKLAAYSVHSLRHSLSTWLDGVGVTESTRMRIVGHEDESVSRGYTHTEMAQAAAALERVPAV